MARVLMKKSAEYATADDKLHNFKRAAPIVRRGQAGALWGMLAKHLVSVADLVERADAGEPPSQEVVDEKIGDCLNYLVLLEAVFAEQRG